MGSTATFLIALLAAAADAPTGRVTGTALVSDQPAAYASAQLVGTTWGALCDGHGAFVIERVPPGTYTLRISLIGTQTATRQVVVRPGETLDAGILRLGAPAAPDLEKEGPRVSPIDPGLVRRVRGAKLWSVDRVDWPAAAPAEAPAARLEGYVRLARAHPPDRAWVGRLAELLADSTAYVAFTGRIRKACAFHADLEIRFEDDAGPIDLWLCFGCNDLLIRDDKGTGAMRDFSPLKPRFLDLALEAFPEDPALLARRRPPKGAGGP